MALVNYFKNSFQFFKGTFYFWVNFLSIGKEVFKGRIKFQNRKIVPDMVVVVYFNPVLINDPENYLYKIKKSFVDAYMNLHGYEPIVIMLPLGYSFNAMDMVDFVSILPVEVKNKMTSALYREKEYRKIITGTI